MKLPEKILAIIQKVENFSFVSPTELWDFIFYFEHRTLPRALWESFEILLRSYKDLFAYDFRTSDTRVCVYIIERTNPAVHGTNAFEFDAPVFVLEFTEIDCGGISDVN